VKEETLPTLSKPSLTLNFVGTGTSVGIPVIGCDCLTCQSDDPKDQRLRSSIYLQGQQGQQGQQDLGADETNFAWLVDTGPDIRQQCLRDNIRQIDAVFYTHAHYDHIMGLDELRRFTPAREDRLPIYAHPSTMGTLEQMFFYTFNGENNYPGYFKPEPHLISDPIKLEGWTITPLEVSHGKVACLGYLFSLNERKVLAYIPDCKTISPAAQEAMQGVETLVIDALRYTEHPTHMNFEETLAFIKTLQPAPQQSYFIHFNCEIKHSEAEKNLPENVHLSYDGLKLELL